MHGSGVIASMFRCCKGVCTELRGRFLVGDLVYEFDEVKQGFCLLLLKGVQRRPLIFEALGCVHFDDAVTAVMLAALAAQLEAGVLAVDWVNLLLLDHESLVQELTVDPLRLQNLQVVVTLA